MERLLNYQSRFVYKIHFKFSYEFKTGSLKNWKCVTSPIRNFNKKWSMKFRKVWYKQLLKALMTRKEDSRLNFSRFLGEVKLFEELTVFCDRDAFSRPQKELLSWRSDALAMCRISEVTVWQSDVYSKIDSHSN